MNTDITVALIGATGVCGTIVGTVLGAKIQARGGHAQAQAARDAAETAAQAAQRQVIRERSWTVLTAYLRAAAELVEATDQLYRSAQAREDVERAYHAFGLVHAEAELALPPGMDEVLADLGRAVRQVYHTARMRSSTERAVRTLDEICQAGDPAAARAKEALTRLRATNPPLWNARLGREAPPQYSELIEALHAVPGLAGDQVRELLNSAAVPHEYESRREGLWSAREERIARRNTYRDARQSFIEAARNVLGTNELQDHNG
ncbi:hypothetical protein [Streptomyces sp. NPDC058495]|uniref:hypothetical protein n=1 Tax=unclassified Streptomyces TaxID=2593676 RepID=UPI003661B912